MPMELSLSRDPQAPGPSWTGWAAPVFILAGLYQGLIVAAPHPEQGDAYRILFIGLPAAWISAAVLAAIIALSVVTLVRRSRLAALAASAMAPTGAVFAFIALWSAALWSRPVLGTWWAWDLRPAIELVLLALYGGFITTKAAIADPSRADRAGALVALVGAFNLAVVFVFWRWGEMPLLPSASLPRLSSGGPVFLALACTSIGFFTYMMFTSQKRLRCLVAEREALAHAPRVLGERTA